MSDEALIERMVVAMATVREQNGGAPYAAYDAIFGKRTADKLRENLREEARAALSALESGGWQDISTAPRDGSEIEVKGDTGPYGLTEWRGRAKWFLPTNWHCSNAHWASPKEAMLGLAGYMPTHWRPLIADQSGGRPDAG